MYARSIRLPCISVFRQNRKSQILSHLNFLCENTVYFSIIWLNCYGLSLKICFPHGTMYRLRLHSLYGLYRPQCLLSEKKAVKLNSSRPSNAFMQCLKLSQKSCRSSCLESQIINITLKKNQQNVPGPPPKLSTSDRRTCRIFQHCIYALVI